jgi:DMSO reductase anchor subunit
MHPAFSVIFFTVSSGIGYGLLGLLGLLAALGLVPLYWPLGALGLGLGFVSVSAGLLSSTFHLGHPERAWRAFTQWRSSWLSREGVAAVVTFGPILILAYGWVLGRGGAAMLEVAGYLTALGALATVYCTAMIYRSLKTIHQWHNFWTLPNYLLLGLAGGAVWLLAVLAVLGLATDLAAPLAAALVAVAWIAKTGYWRFIDTSRHPSTPETATGLGRFGKVSKFEGPHTSANYLMKEMGFQVARKHATKLRLYVHGFAFVFPLIVTLAASASNSPANPVFAVLAAISATFGIGIERWLFFAEAKHVITLYYGAKSA